MAAVAVRSVAVAAAAIVLSASDEARGLLMFCPLNRLRRGNVSIRMSQLVRWTTGGPACVVAMRLDYKKNVYAPTEPDGRLRTFV